jgi:hypothetical protein
MDIAGHVSRQMLARYSHIRMEAERKALEGIVSKPAPTPLAPQPTEEQKPAKVLPVQCSSPRNPRPAHRGPGP